MSGIRPVITAPPWRGTARRPCVPAAFRPPAFASQPSLPAWDSAPLTIGLPAQALDHDGVSAFRTREKQPDWAPPLPRDQRCPHGPGAIPGPPPAASQRRRSCPPATQPSPIQGSCLTRHQSGVHVVRPPGLPLARGHRMTRQPFGFSPGSAPARAGPAHARQGQGQALSTSLELRRWPTCRQPSNLRVHSQYVRPRVALALAGGTVGVRDRVVDVAVLGLGVAGRRGAGLAAGAEQVLQLAARHIATLCMPVVTPVSSDRLEGHVHPAQQVR
jgi:hypothetical protein